MWTIQHRPGHELIAGVNDSFLGFGYRDASTGPIEGFEIDLVHELAKAIFGSWQNHVRLLDLSLAEGLKFPGLGKVDIVVRSMTITRERKCSVDFSTVYYSARQRVLVPSTSTAKGLNDLAGKRVCATKGSVPYLILVKHYPRIIPVQAPYAIDCLAYLQEGRVDAISTDDAILNAIHKQDPFTKFAGPPIAPGPYGMAVSKAHPEFVRFVNGVLAEMRANGTWSALYKESAQKTLGGPVPAPPPATYGGLR
jgi:polar amino acid transport system substrate-binding protein